LTPRSRARARCPIAVYRQFRKTIAEVPERFSTLPEKTQNQVRQVGTDNAPFHGEGMKMPVVKDRLTTAQWILERNLAWIAAADAKVAIIVTINVAMLGGLAGTFGWSDAHRSYWAYGACIMAAILSGSGVFCAAMAMFPKTDGPKLSLLFSVPVAGMTLPDYQEALKICSDEQLLEDWVNNNLDEGQYYADKQFAEMSGDKFIYDEFNKFYELKEGDEDYLEFL
jgi:hypothetical protein